MRPFDPIEKLAATVSTSKGGAGNLVFVNGFGETQEVWAEVASAFSAEFRIVAFDPAGTGRTPPEAFSQHRYLNLRSYARGLGSSDRPNSPNTSLHAEANRTQAGAVRA